MVYIVMKRGWEYNDETNFFTEGGNPQKVFTSLKDATEEAKKLDRSILVNKNSVYIESLDAWNYGDDLRMLSDEQKMELNKIMGTDYDFDNDYDIIVPPNLSDEDIDRILEITGLYFHEVVPMEVN